MKKLYLILVFFFCAQLAWGQEMRLDTYLSPYNTSDFFIVRKVRPVPKKQKNSSEIFTEEEIQKKLLETLNQTIKESNPILRSHSIEYWGLLEYKMGLIGMNDELVDVLTVNKQELGSRILQRIKKQYRDINLSLSLKEDASLENTNQVKSIFQDVEKRLSSIGIEEELLLKVAPNLIEKDSEIEMLKETISKSKNQLRSLFDVQKRSLELEEANQLYIRGRYLEAYKRYQDLNLLYNELEFQQGMQKTLEKIQETYETRIKNFTNRKDYRNALLTLDTLERSGTQIAQLFDERGTQVKVEYFNSLAVVVDNILSHSTKSNIGQLTTYMSAMRPYSEVTPKTHAKFADYSNRVVPLMLETDMAEINSYLYKNNFSSGLRKMQEIKTKYPQNKKIEQLEEKLVSKAYTTKKDALLANRPRIISIEPGYNLISPEVNLDALGESKIANFNPVYHLGIYRRFGFKQKESLDENSTKTRFGYNQIGLKMEYLDINKTYFVTDSLGSDKNAYPARSYMNLSLSLLVGKTLGLDLGYLTYNQQQNTLTNVSNSTQPNGFYTGGVVFYIPFGGFSLGVGSKVISDLKSYNRAQFSFNFKFNFGALKKFTQDDKDEIKNEINKLSF
jgi:hypothetical protein